MEVIATTGCWFINFSCTLTLRKESKRTKIGYLFGIQLWFVCKTTKSCSTFNKEIRGKLQQDRPVRFELSHHHGMALAIPKPALDQIRCNQ